MTCTQKHRHGVLRALRHAFFGSPLAPLRLDAMIRPLDPAAVCHAAGVSRLAELGEREVAEISVPELMDTVALTQRLREAIEGRQLLWVFSFPTDEEMEWVFNELPALAHPLNAQQSTWGINIKALLSRLLTTRPDLRSSLAGVDVTSAPMKLQVLLREHHVQLRHTSMLRRLLHDPRFWIYVLIFVYSALRALPVVFVPQFHGSVIALWAIDILTAIPYAWGVLAMVTARRSLVRLLGTIVTIVTFIAPYLYFWHHGKDYPPVVTIVITVMIITSIALEANRVIQDRHLKRIYSGG